MQKTRLFLKEIWSDREIIRRYEQSPNQAVQSKRTFIKRMVLSKMMIIVLLLFITVVISGLVIMTQQFELARILQTSPAIALVPTLTPSAIPTETLPPVPSLTPSKTPSPTPTKFALSTFSIGQSMKGLQIGAV